MLARESLIRSILLQLLPLSENDRHLGKVSATTWPSLELCLCKYRGPEQRGAKCGHIIRQTDSWVTAFTSSEIYPVTRKESVWASEGGGACVCVCVGGCLPGKELREK